MKVIKYSFVVLVCLFAQQSLFSLNNPPIDSEPEDEDVVMVDAHALALHEAVVTGELDRVQELVGEGADIEARAGAFDCPALHTAVSNGHLEIARYLVDECAAHIEATGGDYDYTPLHLAVYHNQLPIARLLLLRGANVYALDNEGRDLRVQLEEAIRDGIYHDADVDTMRAWLNQVLPLEEEPED
ncbi:ankyrin repeat domain-containing protein [Candidatus Dependentiae bacterium]|nr:ankyrin repeat domain-containing protein [Candidatus Dependentiae bacterium]